MAYCLPLKLKAESAVRRPLLDRELVARHQLVERAVERPLRQVGHPDGAGHKEVEPVPARRPAPAPWRSGRPAHRCSRSCRSSPAGTSWGSRRRPTPVRSPDPGCPRKPTPAWPARATCWAGRRSVGPRRTLEARAPSHPPPSPPGPAPPGVRQPRLWPGATRVRSQSLSHRRHCLPPVSIFARACPPGCGRWAVPLPNGGRPAPMPAGSASCRRGVPGLLTGCPGWRGWVNMPNVSRSPARNSVVSQRPPSLSRRRGAFLERWPGSTASARRRRARRLADSRRAVHVHLTVRSPHPLQTVRAL